MFICHLCRQGKVVRGKEKVSPLFDLLPMLVNHLLPRVQPPRTPESGKPGHASGLWLFYHTKKLSGFRGRSTIYAAVAFSVVDCGVRYCTEFISSACPQLYFSSIFFYSHHNRGSSPYLSEQHVFVNALSLSFFRVQISQAFLFHDIPTLELFHQCAMVLNVQCLTPGRDVSRAYAQYLEWERGT